MTSEPGIVAQACGSALGRLRQIDLEFKANLAYTRRTCLKPM